MCGQGRFFFRRFREISRPCRTRTVSSNILDVFQGGQFLPVCFHHLRVRWNFPWRGHHSRFQREHAYFTELMEIGLMIEHSGSCPRSPARRITGQFPDRRAQEEALDIRVFTFCGGQYWRQGRCLCVHCTLVRNVRVCRCGSLLYSGSLPLVFLFLLRCVCFRLALVWSWSSVASSVSMIVLMPVEEGQVSFSDSHLFR